MDSSPVKRTRSWLPQDDLAAAITRVSLRDGLTPAVVLGGALTALIALGAITGLTFAGISHYRHRHRFARGE